MKYKQIFLITTLVVAGTALLLFILGALAFQFTVFGGIVLILLGMTGFAIFAIPNLGGLTWLKRMALARFGSTEENDIKSHMADIFIGKILTARLVTQLDPRSENGMAEFADALKDLYALDTLPEIKKYYPELSDQQVNAYFQSVANFEKDSMVHVFFPGKAGITHPTQAAEKLRAQYPFVDGSMLHKLLDWWIHFKIRLERQG